MKTLNVTALDAPNIIGAFWNTVTRETITILDGSKHSIFQQFMRQYHDQSTTAVDTARTLLNKYFADQTMQDELEALNLELVAVVVTQHGDFM